MPNRIADRVFARLRHRRPRRGHSSRAFAEAVEPRLLLATISGQVFHDVDANGVRGRPLTEPVLPGWVVFLDNNNNGQADRGEPVSTTDASGSYSFTVGTGTFSVRAVAPPEWYVTAPPDGRHLAVIFTVRDSASGTDFGVARYGSISGFAFEDWDSSGAWDPGSDSFLFPRPAEPMLPGRRLYLDGNQNGAFDRGETGTVTDASGAFTLGGLRPGTYKLTMGPEDGWVINSPQSTYYLVAVAAEQHVSGAAFASYRPGSISGQTYHDLNDDRIKDAGEPGLAAWTVFLDEDGDWLLDAGERAVVTGAAGDYSFEGLPPLGPHPFSGRYFVVAVPPAGWVASTTLVTVVQISSGTQATGNFGGIQLASISGRAYHDLDADGVAGGEETALPGRTVFFDANGSGALDADERRATTDANGAYSFGDLRPGRYNVLIVPQAGWTATAPATVFHTIVLASGQDPAGRDFGQVRTASVSGTSFHDADADGVHDDGEAGLAKREVYVDRADDAPEAVGEVNIISPDSARAIDAARWVEYPFPIGRVLEPAYTTSVSGRAALWGQVVDVDVTIDITHAPTRALSAYLRSPSGTVVGLFGNGLAVGGDGANFTGTTFDDQAAASISEGAAPFTGSYRPAQSLATLNGENPNGLWKLIIVNDQIGAWGTLNGWSLKLTLAAPATTTDAEGAYALSDLLPGRYIIRQINPAGWTGTAPPGGEHAVELADGQSATGVDFGSIPLVIATVVARHAFYNRSSFDGNDPSANATDDSAIATDKTPLLPGQTASFSNVTSYSRGINGVMVDVQALLMGTTALSAADFVFRTGPGGDPAEWAEAPAPSQIAVRRSAVPEQPARVTLVWPDGAIRNAWIQVTVKANGNTGLSSPDVFSFGNRVGETGDNASPLRVSATDVMSVRRNLFSASPITGRFDFNRDGRVDALDLVAVRRSFDRALTATPSVQVAALPESALSTDGRSRTRRGAYELLV